VYEIRVEGLEANVPEIPYNPPNPTTKLILKPNPMMNTSTKSTWLHLGIGSK
jgi:hypothetical protein